MERSRFVVLGVLQTASAGLCGVCGVLDAVFRKDTPLSCTRTPLWAAVIMAVPGVLALFASQKKNHILVSAVVLAAALSSVASLLVCGYSSLTLTYGEDDTQVFYHHRSPHVRFVLHRMVRGANASLLLSGLTSLVLCCALGLGSCRSLLPLCSSWSSCCSSCSCCDASSGRERLVPQSDPEDTEMVCSWRAADDDRLSPTLSSESTAREKRATPPYARLA